MDATVENRTDCKGADTHWALVGFQAQLLGMLIGKCSNMFGSLEITVFILHTR